MRAALLRGDRQAARSERCERLDMNSSLPDNGASDPTLNQLHLITGLTYLPLESLAIKGDVRFSGTGGSLNGPTTNAYVSLGLGYSF